GGERRAALMRVQRRFVHVETVPLEAARRIVVVEEVLDGELLAPLRGEGDQLPRIGDLFIETLVDRAHDRVAQFSIQSHEPQLLIFDTKNKIGLTESIVDLVVSIGDTTPPMKALQ